MQKPNVSFYVLSESKAQDFLGFTCHLIQTALNKSHESLLILVEDESLISELDDALWSYAASGFIPHQRLRIDERISDSNINDSNDVTNAHVTDVHTVTSALLAPVLLAPYLPAEFNGIIVNTTTRPVNDFITATSNSHLTRILEIIRPDTASVQEGRQKYKHYQQLGYELTHFKV